MSTGPGPTEPPRPRDALSREPILKESTACHVMMGPVGLQTLLDLLVGVYQEFRSSTPAREKYIRRFLQWGQWISVCLCVRVCVSHVMKVMNTLLSSCDFKGIFLFFK